MYCTIYTYSDCVGAPTVTSVTCGLLRSFITHLDTANTLSEALFMTDTFWIDLHTVQMVTYCLGLGKTWTVTSLAF